MHRSTVRLNIGGTRFEISKALLDRHPGTRLGAIAADPGDSAMRYCDGYNPKRSEYFFSRPGHIFDVIYSYYVSGTLHLDGKAAFCPHLLVHELSFWGVPLSAVAPCCVKYLRRPSANGEYTVVGRNGDLSQSCSVNHDHHHTLGHDRASASSLEPDPATGLLMVRRNSELFHTLSEAELSEASYGEDGESRREFEKASLRERVWGILEQTEPSPTAAIFMVISVCFIICTVTALILGSLKEFQVVNNATNMSEPMPELEYADTACVIWFTIEYVARVITAPNRLEYVKSPLSIIDVAAITPFYLELLFNLAGVNLAIEKLQRSMVIMRILRVMRVLRVLRVLKVARYSRGFQSLGETLKRSWHELTMMGLFMLTTNLIFSTAVYFLENQEPNSKFDSIPQAAWWCIITMTTVGYGDLCPKTVLGKIMGGVASLVGVLLLAFPISVVVQNFDEVYHEKFGEPSQPRQMLDGNGVPVPAPRRAGTIWGGYRLKSRNNPETVTPDPEL